LEGNIDSGNDYVHMYMHKYIHIRPTRLVHCSNPGSVQQHGTGKAMCLTATGTQFSFGDVSSWARNSCYLRPSKFSMTFSKLNGRKPYRRPTQAKFPTG